MGNCWLACASSTRKLQAALAQQQPRQALVSAIHDSRINQFSDIPRFSAKRDAKAELTCHMTARAHTDQHHHHQTPCLELFNFNKGSMLGLVEIY